MSHYDPAFLLHSLPAAQPVLRLRDLNADYGSDYFKCIYWVGGVVMTQIGMRCPYSPRKAAVQCNGGFEARGKGA